jgi:threonyl-tRNA synthetase
VLSVTDRAGDYAQTVAGELSDAGLRAGADVRTEKIGLKIREAELQKIPYMLIVGDRESQSNTVSLRAHGRKDMGTMPVSEVVKLIADADRPGVIPGEHSSETETASTDR